MTRKEAKDTPNGVFKLRRRVESLTLAEFERWLGTLDDRYTYAPNTPYGRIIDDLIFSFKHAKGVHQEEYKE